MPFPTLLVVGAVLLTVGTVVVVATVFAPYAQTAWEEFTESRTSWEEEERRAEKFVPARSTGRDRGVGSGIEVRSGVMRSRKMNTAVPPLIDTTELNQFALGSDAELSSPATPLKSNAGAQNQGLEIALPITPPPLDLSPMTRARSNSSSSTTPLFSPMSSPSIPLSGAAPESAEGWDFIGRHSAASSLRSQTEDGWKSLTESLGGSEAEWDRMEEEDKDVATSTTAYGSVGTLRPQAGMI